MAKVNWKGSTLLGPVPPTMVSCGTVEAPNVLCVAWTGIVNSNPPMTYVSIRPERYSHDLIQASGEFVINLTPSRLVRSCDYVGVRSGRDENKFETCKLTALPCSKVKAPQIAECPVSLECRVKEIKPLGSHDMFLAEIVGVNVDEELLDEEGKLHLEKAGLLSYIHGEYFAQGKKVGSFGYSVRKRPNPKKKTEGKKRRK
ncbi:MAG: flavin reductase family protein [Negativibacillus sp.]